MLYQRATYWKVIIINVILFVVGTLTASDIIIESSLTRINTSPHISIFRDTTNLLKIEDFLLTDRLYNFEANENNIIKNKRSPGSQFWMKMSLRNNTDKLQDLRLVARSDALLYTYYETQEDSILNSYVSGMNISTNAKPLQHNSVAFPLRLPAHQERIIYIQCDNDHIATEIFYLESISSYDRSLAETGIWLGGVIGFLFLSALIAIILYFITKERINFFYALYATSNAISFFIASRIFQFSIIPDIATGHVPQFIGVLITSIFFLKFIQEYYSNQGALYLRKTIFYTYTLAIGVFIVLILTHSFIAEHITVSPIWERFPMILLSIMCLYAYSLIIKFAIQKPTWKNILFLFAFFGIIFSSVIAVGIRNGFVQAHFLFNHSYVIALILEFSVLSIILVYDLINTHSQRAIFATKLETQEKELQQAQLLKIALEEKDTLLREIHHRVKNNLQVISALLTLQSKHVKDDTAVEALKEGQGRVESMALIHQDLYQHDNLKGVNTKDYFEKLVDNLIHTYKTDDRNIELECNIESLMLDVDTMIPLGLVVNELTSNALKHAFTGKGHGLITITLQEVHNQLRLQVVDDGQGVEPHQLEHKSFGFSLIRSFARRLDADLNVANREGLHVELLINNYQKAS